MRVVIDGVEYLPNGCDAPSVDSALRDYLRTEVAKKMLLGAPEFPSEWDLTDLLAEGFRAGWAAFKEA